MRYVRTTRKACINDIGKKKFGFNYNEELIKYKYFTGERMNSSEWNKLDGCEKCNSYFEWKESIEKKTLVKQRNN